MNYLDYCILSDLDLIVNSEGGWQPSYIAFYDPTAKADIIASFQKKKRENDDCHTQTNITLTADKQGLICNGASSNVCGMRHLPERGRSTSSIFIDHFQFDPKGSEELICEDKRDKNFYRLMGSYYHVYVKLASCSLPTGKI